MLAPAISNSPIAWGFSGVPAIVTIPFSIPSKSIAWGNLTIFLSCAMGTLTIRNWLDWVSPPRLPEKLKTVSPDSTRTGVRVITPSRNSPLAIIRSAVYSAHCHSWPKKSKLAVIPSVADPATVSVPSKLPANSLNGGKPTASWRFCISIANSCCISARRRNRSSMEAWGSPTEKRGQFSRGGQVASLYKSLALANLGKISLRSRSEISNTCNPSRRFWMSPWITSSLAWYCGPSGVWAYLASKRYWLAPCRNCPFLRTNRLLAYWKLKVIFSPVKVPNLGLAIAIRLPSMAKVSKFIAKLPDNAPESLWDNKDSGRSTPVKGRASLKTLMGKLFTFTEKIFPCRSPLMLVSSKSIKRERGW